MTPEQVREYWRAHEARFADIDWERDPDGLAGYLGPGQPTWLNERYAALQRDVFERLLARVPGTSDGDRALDVGCGAGRWTRRLAARGYRAVGVDLQEGIIDANRRRFPEIEWRALPLQDLPTDERYALVTSVGVLEMIPYEEQREVVERLVAALTPEGRVIVLAALTHPSANSYPHRAGEWAELFARAGLLIEEQIAFGWEPLRRGAAAAVRTLTSSRGLTPRIPTELPPVDGAAPGGPVWRAPRGLRVVAAVDDRLEPLLQRLGPRRASSRWGAFLLRLG